MKLKLIFPIILHHQRKKIQHLTKKIKALKKNQNTKSTDTNLEIQHFTQTKQE